MGNQERQEPLFNRIRDTLLILRLKIFFALKLKCYKIKIVPFNLQKIYQSQLKKNTCFDNVKPD